MKVNTQSSQLHFHYDNKNAMPQNFITPPLGGWGASGSEFMIILPVN